ncbi:MAG: NADH-quinone oxidoreductase subunit L [Pirellulales bacterium]
MSDSLQSMILWLIPGAPLAAAVVTAALGPRLLRDKSHWPCWLALAVSSVCSLVLLLAITPEGFERQDHADFVVTGYEWIGAGDLNVPIQLRADAMSSLMLAMVTFVSLMVAVFGAGYMHGDRGYPRFFAAVSLFVFSMCMLVLAPNFLTLYVFWEGVGLCSYLLIGFWFERPAAAAAAKKAFVVNRIGDFGLLLAIFLIWTTFGSLDFAQVLDRPDVIAQIAAAQPGRITLICLLLFLGAMGKSAQFPLHVWLPDAMEGPTPVSALIHAATMVTAGVYLVARCTPLFVHAPTAQLVVSAIGATTAVLAALIALTQMDLKRVLAYSTVSQLGLMFAALGAGASDAHLATVAVTAAMFHLFTHAFFKALLFLSAGSVMHAMGDVIDMRRFSGLRRALPITHWTFLCGAAALAGVPPLAGFWSKDDILAVLGEAADGARYGSFFSIIHGLMMFTALLTAFYTFRAYFMTFGGPERFPAEAGHHPHDAPPLMAWPLRVLALGAIVVGAALGPTHWFADYLHHTPGLHPTPSHGLHVSVMVTSAVIALAGIGLAWLFYLRNPRIPASIASRLDPLYSLSLHKFYLDELFWGLIVAPLRFAAWLASFADRLLDWLVDFIGKIPKALSAVPSPLHNGLVSSYAIVMWAGVAVCVAIALKLLP